LSAQRKIFGQSIAHTIIVGTSCQGRDLSAGRVFLVYLCLTPLRWERQHPPGRAGGQTGEKEGHSVRLALLRQCV